MSNSISRDVHLSDYASQPDIKIACDQRWTTPKWGKRDESMPDGVYEDDDGKLYAFDVSKITCELCDAFARRTLGDEYESRVASEKTTL